ncbi:unnamed protein product [Rhizophagus irregularis]|uniref:Uncharacterized protein n=1 Tax=Rhizophagus irregularis TaxID=588596 RepID=A0A2N1N3A2_9GLOM|nr:hypothetical protein RhiirC2_782301 [Rhizophagus irregularis]CAB4377092.1 unnamed protein product [Rhizophagus irregularis]CAB5382193.1 unnamed protein product [Rhizophagus irregularis]
MKLQSFYLLTIFFMCLSVLESQAYKATIKQTLGVLCRFWVEDANHNRIAGDGKRHYHTCDGADKVIEFGNQQYYIVAKVEASLQQEKVRGPFDGDHSCFFYGTIGNWSFDC